MKPITVFNTRDRIYPKVAIVTKETGLWMYDSLAKDELLKGFEGHLLIDLFIRNALNRYISVPFRHGKIIWTETTSVHVSSDLEIEIYGFMEEFPNLYELVPSEHKFYKCYDLWESESTEFPLIASGTSSYSSPLKFGQLSYMIEREELLKNYEGNVLFDLMSTHGENAVNRFISVPFRNNEFDVKSAFIVSNLDKSLTYEIGRKWFSPS